MPDDEVLDMVASWLRETAARLPPARSATGAFATEAFIARAAASGGTVDDRGAATLDALCKKVEVVRRVCIAYAADLAGVVDRSPVTGDHAMALCGVYLAAAAARRDPKLLNTAMKMLDGCLKEPSPEAPSCLRQWAGRLLDAWPWPAAAGNEALPQ